MNAAARRAREAMTAKRTIDFGLPRGYGGERLVLPHDVPRSAPLTCAAIFAVMAVPAWFLLDEMGHEWARGNYLFAFFIALFLTAWSGPMVMLAALVLRLLVGTEVLVLRPGRISVHAGALGVFLGAEYRISGMRNLRVEVPDRNSPSAWRGRHLAFEYDDEPVGIGAHLSGDAVDAILYAIETAGEEGERAEDARLATERRSGYRGPEPAVAPLPGGDEAIGLGSASTIALVGANLVPLAGAVLLGWNLADVMFIYWAESGVIGFYNVLKMLIVGGAAAIVLALFFVGHYGGFMLAHLIFIFAIFVDGDALGGGHAGRFDVAGFAWVLGTALAAQFVSHGVSFFQNFVGQHESDARTMGRLMFEPYKRIIAMHATIIVGGGIAVAIGDPAPVLAALIAVKTAVDLRAHLREHAA